MVTCFCCAGVLHVLSAFPNNPESTPHALQPRHSYSRSNQRVLTHSTGRIEFRIFLVLYLLTLPFQLISEGSFLEQGSTALTAITAVHAGLVASTFWVLLANAIVSTQVVEDGTISALLVRTFRPCSSLARGLFPYRAFNTAT